MGAHSLPKITRGYLRNIAELAFPVGILKQIGFKEPAAKRIVEVAYRLNSRDLRL